MRSKHPPSKRGGARAAKTVRVAKSRGTTQPPRATHGFTRWVLERFDPGQLQQLWRAHQTRRRPPVLSFAELWIALLYHVLVGEGALEQHVEELFGVSLSSSALSQRRGRLPWKLFQELLRRALAPRATPAQHPQAFYKGLRLVGLDGTRLSLRNVPAILAGLSKAVSRRLQAAFAQVTAVLLVELGTHNPLAVEIGREQESEYALAGRLVGQLRRGWLLLADRLYGVPSFVVRLWGGCQEAGSEFLVRVRRNLKRRVLARLPDGSAEVEIIGRDEQGRKVKLLVREIHGVVRSRSGKRSEVRLWTSLLDARKYPAAELLALYAQRWEVEITVQEWKGGLGGGELSAAQTPTTAAQEIAAFLLVLSVLAEVRCAAARGAGAEVLRVSFRQTVRWVRELWQALVLLGDALSKRQVRLLRRRTRERIAARLTPVRRARSCPRAVRQPVGSWPRLLARREWHGAIRYQIMPVRAGKS